MRYNRLVVTPALFIKRVLVVVGGLVLVWAAYRWALHTTLRKEHVITGTIALYSLTAYIVLPRLHNILARFYLPNYFSGRTHTSDGLLSDPVNIAFIGSRRQLENAMLKTGWVIADPTSLKSLRKAAVSVLLKRSYPAGPASPQYLFGRRQDYSFQKEIGQNARKRHHIRIWKVPQDWRLAGGKRVDWLGAAHRDSRVGLSYFTGQLMHKISPNLDRERKYLVNLLKREGRLAKATTFENFMPAYKHYNAGGDRFHTDGHLTIIDLK